MAGATYSVNIELNTKELKRDLGELDTLVKDLGRKGIVSSSKKNKVDEKGLTINGKSLAGEEKRLGLAIKRQKVDTRMRKLEEKGVQLARLRNKQAGKYASMEQLSDAQKDKEWRVGKLIANNLSLEVKKIEDKIQRQNIQNAAKQKELNIAIKLRKLGDSAGSLGTKIGRVNRGNKVGPGGGAYGLPSSDMLKADSRGIQNLNKIGSLEERSLRRAERKLRLEKEMTAENRRRNAIKPNIAGADGVYSGRRRRPGLGAIRDYRRGTVLQSAAISGAFPLLFGQGPVTAAAGAVGGGLGAKFGGQMGGFAGGLAATTAVQAISGAVAGVRDLGQAMGPFVEDTSALMKATGQTNTFREKELKLIEQVRGKQAAFNAAMKDMAKVVGQKGVEALKTFGEDTKRLSDDWARFMTQMGAGMARLINWSGLLKESGRAAVKRARGEEYSGDETLQGLLGERDALGRRRSMGKGANAAEILEIQKKIKERLNYLDEKGLTLQDEKLKKLQREEAQMKNIASLYKDIGDSVKDGLVDAIDAAIAGTKSLGEVAGSVLRDIGRTILQYGINSFLVSLFPNSETWGKIFGRASGGPVKGGDPYVVGEKGPELFVPKSSGNIVPNHAMGGSMVVNVDASGSSAEGDSDRSRQLGELIGAAVQSEIIRQQRPGGTLY